ncbi:MAG: hypothetical protein N2C13_05195 [Chloroflexota bacterium]
MDFSMLSPWAVGLVFITSLSLLLSHDWRVSIASLGLQYLGVFMLVAVSWPINLAVVKLVAGWMSASILGVTRGVPGGRIAVERIWPTEWLFRVMAASLVVLAVFSLTPQFEEIVPNISPYQVGGGLLLIGMGLLHHALTQHALQALLGLMTVLSGFEILYAVVESSTLVAGLLAVINLGIALAGAYLLATYSIEGSI